LIKNGSGTGIKQVYYFNAQGNNKSYIKLGTLKNVSATGLETSKVMFTVKGGIGFGGTNESVYEVAASTRGSIQVTSTLVRGNRELKFGYVSTSSNVEIWMAYDGTYRGATEVEVSSSVNFTLTMTETTTKPSGFVEGSYRILAATADNVASATKLQTPRTIWGQSFDGTADITGVMTIKPPTITDGKDNTIMFKVCSSTGYKNGFAISSTDNVTRLYAKPFGSGTRNALEIHTYNNTDVNAVIIAATGNVGIGTNPAYKLHVAGDIYTTTGFKKNGSSDSYVLLGGGGHKLERSLNVAYSNLTGITLTGGDSNNEGYRLIFEKTMGGWNINYGVWAIAFRHSGRGTLNIGFDTTNSDGSTYIYNIRFLGSTASRESTPFRAFYNSTTKVFRIYWHYYDYTSGDIAVLRGNMEPHNGTWMTSLPNDVGTELAITCNMAD
jgi:hypothetical protein